MPGNMKYNSNDTKSQLTNPAMQTGLFRVSGTIRPRERGTV